MSVIKRLPRLLILFTLLFITSQQLSYASGGFPDRPGRLIISGSASYFFANSKWDTLGVKHPFDNNGQYSSIGFTLFAEYGISRRFAAVASVPYVMNAYQDDKGKSTSSGLTDMETGIKYYLANIAYKYYFSLQATAITPLYNNQTLGYNEEGAELKLAFSGTGHLFGQAPILTWMTGYANILEQTAQYKTGLTPLTESRLISSMPTRYPQL